MTTTISYQALSAHIVRHFAAAQVAGTKPAAMKLAACAASERVEVLATDLGVRQVDVRRSLSALHKQGLVDVAQMRLTLAGFALGKALEGRQLRAIRIPQARQSRAA